MARQKSTRTVTHEREPAEADLEGRHVGAPQNGAVAVEDEPIPPSHRLTPVAPPAPEILNIHVEMLTPSPTNPRRAAGDLRELAESIRTKGVLQPLLVRRAQSGDRFEIVFGHRRYLAAVDVGLQSLPCMVRELDDLAVLEAQIIENVQRLDVHPMDEAEGYERLMKFGRKVEEIVATTGKSRATIYARLKLLDLCKKARDIFLEGKIEASHALLAARIPGETLQREFLKDIGVWSERGLLAYRDALDLAHRDYMLRLSEATFDVAAEDLVPKCGSCLACPKRTGNEPVLFADVKGPDTCTDPTCFRAKTDAAFEIRAAKHKDAGGTVMSKTEAKKAFPYRGGRVDSQSGYVDLNATCNADAKYRSNAAVLGKAKKDLPIVLARDPQEGEVHELVEAKVLEKKLRELGVVKKRAASSSKPKRGKPTVDEAEIADGVVTAAANAVRHLAPTNENVLAVGRATMFCVLDLLGPHSLAVEAAHALFADLKPDVEQGKEGVIKRKRGMRADPAIAFLQYLEEQPAAYPYASLHLLLRHLALDSYFGGSREISFPKPLVDACAQIGQNLDAMFKAARKAKLEEVERAAAEAKKEKKPKKGAKAKKSKG